MLQLLLLPIAIVGFALVLAILIFKPFNGGNAKRAYYNTISDMHTGMAASFIERRLIKEYGMLPEEASLYLSIVKDGDMEYAVRYFNDIAIINKLIYSS